MSPAAATLEARLRHLPRAGDGLLRDLSDLDRVQLEMLRNAIDSTLARRQTEEQAAGQQPEIDRRDTGFPCEWWPPD